MEKNDKVIQEDQSPPTPHKLPLFRGFVEVSEKKGEEETFMNGRFARDGTLTEERILELSDHFNRKLDYLKRDITNLKQKFELFEEDLQIKWGPKYTRRLAIFINILHGMFIFVSRFIRRIQKRRAKIIQNMMVPNAASLENFNVILHEAYIFGIAKSWVFFVAALCVTSSASWKRNCGLLISVISSLYFMFESKFLPAVNLINIATTLLYIFALWATTEKHQPNVKSLQDYIVSPHTPCDTPPMLSPL